MSALLMPRGWMDKAAFGGAREPYCRRSAWCWLIENAGERETHKNIAGRTVTLRRGQLSWSLRSMAAVWAWDKGRVARFLRRLREDSMIETATSAGQVVVTICNYDRYQGSIDAAPLGVETAPRQQQDDATPAKAAVAIAVEAFNTLAKATGLPRVQRVTDARRRALAARLRECGGITGWEMALVKVRESDFLTGRVPSRDGGAPFRADIDFLCRQSAFTKLLEGGFDNRRPAPSRHTSGPSEAVSAFADIAARARAAPYT